MAAGIPHIESAIKIFINEVLTYEFIEYQILMYCATSRKFAGSIPDGVVESFHSHNPIGRTVALGSTQPLTEMSTRNISWGVKAAGA
jgi:hypothetical protein